MDYCVSIVINLGLYLEGPGFEIKQLHVHSHSDISNLSFVSLPLSLSIYICICMLHISYDVILSLHDDRRKQLKSKAKY
jgi:hypothetical protein